MRFPANGLLSLSLRGVFFAFRFYRGASKSWAPAVLGLLLGGHAEAVSARLNPSHGTVDGRPVCVPRFCLVTTKIWSDGHQSPWHVTALGAWTDRVIALRQIRVTAPCYRSILFRK